MKNYLVTGGAGFIGSALARKLLETQNSLTIIDNLSTGFRENVPPCATFIEGDCSDEDTIARLNGQKFDVIFHIAGQSSGEISFEDPVYDINSNTVSTLRLLDYARKVGCFRFIYASTMSVYGETVKEQCSENDITNPKSFYAVGKRASEEYLKIFSANYGINFTSLRYFNVYGPGQNMVNMKQGMVSIYLKQLIDQRFKDVLVKGSLARFRDFIYIDDVVYITIDAVENDKMYDKIINVGTGVKTTVKQLLDLLMKETNITKVINEINETPGDQFGIYADNGLLKNCNNYTLHSLEYGIKKFVESIRF